MTVCCSVLQCVAVCCGVLQCAAVCCNRRSHDSQPLFLHPVVAFCNTLQHTATHTATHCNTHCNILQHTATHCNTLQHTTTHCNALQRTATHCGTLQHTATHCNTLQQTGSHRNKLQHTAIFGGTVEILVGHAVAAIRHEPLQNSPSVLQCVLHRVAVCCSVLQCVEVFCSV